MGRLSAAASPRAEQFQDHGLAGAAARQAGAADRGGAAGQRDQMERRSMTMKTILLAAALVCANALPARAADMPFYCWPFASVERSCAGVASIVKRMGIVRAERLARKCGASADEISAASACLPAIR